MTSNRNNPVPDDPLLDAARDCILAVGWRRTTLTEVSRRAGVSRMTLYRRWPDMQTLLSDLMAREWSAVALMAAEDATAIDSAAARLAAGATAMIRSLRANPLFRKIVEVDPELLLPYLLDRRGRSQDTILELIEQTIVAGQTEGSIRGTDPKVLARSVLLAGHGWAISSDIMTDDAVSEDQLFEQLRCLVERYVAR